MTTVAPAADTSPGLSTAEAAALLGRDGPNVLERKEATSPWVILAGQFKGTMTWLLLGACVVSGALGEVTDALAIAAIVVLNGLVGFFQEYRAERAVLALRALSAPHARVLRDGRATVVEASQVVMGDVLLLEAGDIVAADAKVLLAHNLLTQEAALTGESAPVEKNTTPSKEGAPLAERHDEVFMGTPVSAGTGRALVVGTGMKTELGRISHLLNTAEEGDTPLVLQLERVGRTLVMMCLGVVALVAVTATLRGMGWMEVLMASVSLAVAAVPEGLPAIVTVALAMGVQRMAKRNVLVRKMQAVETLGCATVICTDKTGTLTTGSMVVREVWGADRAAVLFAGVACNDAEIGADGKNVGDPTEVALLLAARDEAKLTREQIEQARPRTHVEPFDSTTRRMVVARSDGHVYVKGALEAVLPLCVAGVEGAEAAATAMAARGLRVLAVALGDGTAPAGLRLLGLTGIADPPRPEAVAAVRHAREAGVRTVMITGDHPVTAAAIALEMGILLPGENPEGIVHARATPEDKIKIVRAWKAKGAVVAMTGDGVNDAPALKEAHIGIAMGKGGTEVAREASAMVLTDDNFASILAAIHEGRGIFQNIQRALVYLLAGNVGELMLMLAATLMGLPLPLLPLHLLWINLVTDGLPALAVVMEPSSPELLKMPPRNQKDPMLGRAQWLQVLFTALVEATVVLVVFEWALQTRTLEVARSVAFSTLVFSEVIRGLSARSSVRTFVEMGPAGNPLLLGVVVFSILMQLAILEVEVVHRFFGLGATSWDQVLVCGVAGLIPCTVLEVSKLVRRALHKG